MKIDVKTHSDVIDWRKIGKSWLTSSVVDEWDRVGM